MRVLFFIFFSLQVFAWEGHYLLTYGALRDWSELSGALIKPESLDKFVLKEKDSLEKLLKDYEDWAGKNIKSYPALPKNLAFNNNSNTQELTRNFLYSIRVNPEIEYINFVLYPPGVNHRIKNSFTPEEKIKEPVKTLLALSADNPVVEKIGERDLVSPVEILTAASEEPDQVKLDIGLFEDNNTSYGPLMGLGKQPFGNPVVSYSSQAPFHMGFYYEKPILYAAASWLKQSYPEYRISLFLTLSRHAFATGHDYWGYRFLGWALHYIQDLTQPYHSTLAPGWSWLKLIALNTLELLGVPKPAQDLRQLLTNRHLVLENYQFESAKNISSNDLLSRALTNYNQDKKYPIFSTQYPREIVAKESHDRANLLDSLIVNSVPAKYVNKPDYIFTGTDPLINIREIAFKHNFLQAHKLDFEFINLMSAYGSHTRNAIRALLPKP